MGPLTTDVLNWDPARLHECPWQRGFGAGSEDAEPEEEPTDETPCDGP